MLNGPISVVPHRDKAFLFTRSSILFRPLTPSNEREFGGAAGYRPRVRSAYYRRVYVHSPKGRLQYRDAEAQAQGAICATGTGDAQVMHNPCTTHAYRTRRKVKGWLRKWDDWVRMARSAERVKTSLPLATRRRGAVRRMSVCAAVLYALTSEKDQTNALAGAKSPCRGRPGDARRPAALVPRGPGGGRTRRRRL